MRKLEKFLVSCSLAFGVALMAWSLSWAISSVRTPKPTKMVSSSAGVLVVSGPGAVYSVFMTTAATVGDWLVLRDSNTANTTSAPMVGNILPSATLNTQVTFDPPLVFYNGLSANYILGVGSATITYDIGRNIQN